jgi:hypothetical protein
MPGWEVAIWEHWLPRLEAIDTLKALKVETFRHWSGDMPPREPRSDEEREMQRARAEGDRMRQEELDRLHRIANGQPLDGPRLNADGDEIDSQGRIIARSAKHIKEILARKARKRR